MDSQLVLKVLAGTVCIGMFLFVPNVKCTLPICEALIQSTQK